MNSSKSSAIAPVEMIEMFDATKVLNSPFRVVLVNSVKPSPFGDRDSPVIPDPDGLLKAVAQARVAHPRKMSGRDVKFVRKVLGMKQKELAEAISVSPEHMSRYEAGAKALTLQSEILIRLLVFATTIPFTGKKNEDASKIGEAIGKFFKDLKISPVHDADEDFTLYLRRVSNRKNIFNDCSEGHWDEKIAA